MNALNQIRKLAGQVVFNQLIFPRVNSSSTVQSYDGDYGHGFLYEDLFAGDGSDLVFAADWCRKHPGKILDLAGGAGRLSISLATEGHAVHLVDRSTTMLDIARRKQNALGADRRKQIQIFPQDMIRLELDDRFQTIFSLNNGLEHPESELAILACLRKIFAHLDEKGAFFLDVHNLDFHEREWHFKERIWHYHSDKIVDGQRYRLWGRTSSTSKSSQIITEHAVSVNLRDFVLMKTTVHCFTSEQWTKLFEVAGFQIVDLWGDWNKSPVNVNSPKLVFHLKRRPPLSVHSC